VSTVGIIVNPASGKDIRRVIAAGTVVTNQEKINTVLRLLRACDAVGVDRVLMMPDPTHIARRAMKIAEPELRYTAVAELELDYMLGTWQDTLRATQRFAQLGVNCLVVLGGDGTSRVVAKASGDLPLLPISTGTNNAFPQMIEGTLAGLAAAAIASGVVPADRVCRRAPQLELYTDDGELLDIALADLVVLDSLDTGALAVWDSAGIRALFLTRASPSAIGLSSIGGWLGLDACPPDHALAVHTGAEQGRQLIAPIAPGLLAPITVNSHQFFDKQTAQKIPLRRGVIALDGEREILISERLPNVRINPMGPRVLNVDCALQEAATAGMLDASRLPQ